MNNRRQIDSHGLLALALLHQMTTVIIVFGMALKTLVKYLQP